MATSTPPAELGRRTARTDPGLRMAQPDLPPARYAVYCGDRRGPMEFHDYYETGDELETGAELETKLRRLFADKPSTFRAAVGILPIWEESMPCQDGICFARDPMEGVWDLVLTDPAGTADELLEAVRAAVAHAATASAAGGTGGPGRALIDIKEGCAAGRGGAGRGGASVSQAAPWRPCWTGCSRV